jgi:hypothetical protein
LECLHALSIQFLCNQGIPSTARGNVFRFFEKPLNCNIVAPRSLLFMLHTVVFEMTRRVRRVAINHYGAPHHLRCPKFRCGHEAENQALDLLRQLVGVVHRPA